MAFNEILVGRLNRYVQKLLVIKNTALRGLAPDLQSVLQIQSGVEDRYLQGWNRYGAFSSVAAVAAQLGGLQLRNPIGSNLLIVLESFTANTGTAAPATGCRITSGAKTTDLTTVGSGLRIDARSGSSSAGILSTGTVGALYGNTLWQFQMAANVTFFGFNNPNQEITVLPGDSVQLLDETPNQLINFSMTWRERLLESSELT